MDTMPSYLFLSFVVFFLLLKLKNKKHHHLPPSPPSLPVLGHLHLFKKPLHRALAALAAAHGPVLLLRFGSCRVLHVTDTAVADECLTTHDVTFANRPRFPSARHLSNGYTTLGSSSYGPNWRNLRRIATVEVLSMHRLLSSAAIRATEVRDMARRLFLAAAATSPDASRFVRVDVKARTFELALNIVMQMIAGKRYYGEDAEGSEGAARFREMVEEAFALQGASNLQDFVPVLGLVDFGGAKKRAARLARRRNDWAQKLIDEHRMCVADKERTMMGDMLEMQQSEPEMYSDKVIRSLCLSILQTGINTSSSTIE